MVTWFALIISPVCPSYGGIVILIGYPRFPRSCVFLKGSRYSPWQVAICRFSLDRSSLIFSGFPNSSIVSVRLTGGGVERLRLWCSVVWRVGLILYFVKLAEFSESFNLVSFAWGPSYGSVLFGCLIASREEIAEQKGSRPDAIESYTASEVDVGIGKYS